VSVRARALGAGVAVALVYLASAVLSGDLSPLARRPLLDGLAPPTAYRWVEPPPGLVGSNEQPTPLTLQIALGKNGSETAVPTTGDAQVSLILPEGAFDAAEGQRAVRLTIDPVSPSSVSPAASPLTILGNVYELAAEYVPSGKRAPLQVLSTVVLVYPLLPNDHGTHTVLWSRTGATWEPLQTDDLPSIQQAGGDLDALGYVAVAGEPASPTAAAGSQGGSSAATIAIVGGLIVLAVVAGLLLRRNVSRRDAAGR
jgi:hypothetical protein